jgi:hypothetical protein
MKVGNLKRKKKAQSRFKPLSCLKEFHHYFCLDFEKGKIYML